MIYDFPEVDEPIRQGDIFCGVPRVDLSLRQMPVITEGEQAFEDTWANLLAEGGPITTVVTAKPVFAIVMSQDCDAARARDITLCEVRPFRDVERKSKDVSAPKKWVSILTQHARINQKWFYLPPDDRIGFGEKMGVDFLVTICLRRGDLEGLRRLRKGRLNEVAEAHFRERAAEFFRRYPYDEWYALDEQELEAYKKAHGEVPAYPWQRTI